MGKLLEGLLEMLFLHETHDERKMVRAEMLIIICDSDDK